MSEIKFLGDGDAVLVVGDAPARNTSTDGGRTLTEVPQTYVARLELEEVHNDQLLDERPEIDAATGSPVVAVEAPDAQPQPQAGPPLEPVPVRGDAKTADELQAEIDSLRAQLDASEAQERAEDAAGNQGDIIQPPPSAA